MALSRYRKNAIPNEGELCEYGDWDPSGETFESAVPGCRHLVQTTAALNVSDICACCCRFCFRKRLVRSVREKTMTDVEQGLAYIADHPEIRNVLLTGGDSLFLPTTKLRRIIHRMIELEHVKIIRLFSKILVSNPMRIYQDPALLELFRECSDSGKRIYIMTHINHPREITPEALKGMQALQVAGVILANQTPVLKGINDDPAVMRELLDRLTWAGVTPYEILINRPAAGTRSYMLPLKDAYRIVEEAKAGISGLGNRVRLTMSHQSGKIEILAIENGKAYLKYLHARNGDNGRFMVLDCPDDAVWFDDLPGHETDRASESENEDGPTSEQPHPFQSRFIMKD